MKTPSAAYLMKQCPRSFTNLLLFVILTASLISCGGGGGGSEPPTTASRTITGVVNAPTSSPRPGTANRSIPNILVELFQIDNSGNPVGPALGSATTNANGEFSIDIADSLELSANLVLRATINGSETINAIVTSTTVNITPSSQYVYQEIIANPDVVLASIPLADIQTVVAYIDAQSINTDSQSNLTNALSLISTQIGSEIDTQLQTVVLPDGTWGNVAWDNARFQ